MMQRVAIARALANDPEVLLMDEPFGALDAQTKELLQAELLRIQAATGKTIVFVTHDLDEAVYVADRVIVMSPRPGRVDLDLTIDIPRPRRWSGVHENASFQHHVREVREIFEAKGVLVAH
jgi:NitT/TauT family transport system ATP-binding protein